jgi:hypothetical protein
MRGSLDGARLSECSYTFSTSSEESQMRAKRKGTVAHDGATNHPYKKYESHRYWKRIDNGITDLVHNQDLVEQTARPYIVGYLCKMLLSRKKAPKRK